MIEQREEVIDKSNLSMSGLKKNSAIKRVDEEARRITHEAEPGLDSALSQKSKQNNIEFKVLMEEWPKAIEW